MENLKFLDFEPQRDAFDLGLLYNEVFSEPPWNEYTQCMSCRELFKKSTQQGQICPKSACQGELELAYPPQATVDYVLDDYAQRQAHVKVIRSNDILVAFSWGYPENVKDIIERKYSTEEMRLLLTGKLGELGINDRIYYISDCGVKKGFRGQGYSNLLVGSLFEEARRLRLGVVLRTVQESPMILVARKFGMQQLLGPEIQLDEIKRSFVLNGNAVNNIWDLEDRRRLVFANSPNQII